MTPSLILVYVCVICVPYFGVEYSLFILRIFFFILESILSLRNDELIYEWGVFFFDR